MASSCAASRSSCIVRFECPLQRPHRRPIKNFPTLADSPRPEGFEHFPRFPLLDRRRKFDVGAIRGYRGRSVPISRAPLRHFCCVYHHGKVASTAFVPFLSPLSAAFIVRPATLSSDAVFGADRRANHESIRPVSYFYSQRVGSPTPPAQTTSWWMGPTRFFNVGRSIPNIRQVAKRTKTSGPLFLNNTASGQLRRYPQWRPFIATLLESQLAPASVLL